MCPQLPKHVVIIRYITKQKCVLYFRWTELCARSPKCWECPQQEQQQQPTSRFSSLCFSDCKVCDSCVKVSAGPLDTSPIVFLVPASFFLPPARASPGSAPLWLSHRANFEVSSLMVSFWFMMVSFCCKTVSRSCITVVFKSSPGTLFCKVAAHMSISLGTDVQMNCVCPPKSWEELSKTRQEHRKSLQQIALFVARMLASVLACFCMRVRGWVSRSDFATASPLVLLAACGGAAVYIERARFCAEQVHCITTGGGGGRRGGTLSLFNRLQKQRHIQESKPILLSGSHTLNLSSFRLFVISRSLLFIWKTRICRRQRGVCLRGGVPRGRAVFVLRVLRTLTHTQTHTQLVDADQKLQQFMVPADSAPRTAPTTSQSSVCRRCLLLGFLDALFSLLSSVSLWIQFEKHRLFSRPDSPGS